MGRNIVEKVLQTQLREGESTPGKEIGGGIGQIAIGAGGMDATVAMGGGPLFFICPKVFSLNYQGASPSGCRPRM